MIWNRDFLGSDFYPNKSTDYAGMGSSYFTQYILPLPEIPKPILG